jgi:hypothetical protein
MRIVAEELNLDVPVYIRSLDPLYDLAEEVKSDEKSTVSDKHIPPKDYPLPDTLNRAQTGLVKEERLLDEDSLDKVTAEERTLPEGVSVGKNLPGWYGKGVRKGAKRRRVMKS